MTFNNPLQVRLYESNEEGFTSRGQHRQIAYGDVRFAQCVHEVLSIVTASGLHKARIISLDNHIVRIGIEHPRHLTGMRTTSTSNNEHRWFTLEFRPMVGVDNLAEFYMLVQQVCALTLLYPDLMGDDLVLRHFVDEMVRKCQLKTMA